MLSASFWMLMAMLVGTSDGQYLHLIYPMHSVFADCFAETGGEGNGPRGRP